MNFRLGQPQLGAPARLVSEGGRWEVSLHLRTFGRFAVIVGMTGEMGHEVEYCCGEDPGLRLEVMALCCTILGPLDEAALTPGELRRLFPPWKRRHIDRDPECLGRLHALAAEAEEKLFCEKHK